MEDRKYRNLALLVATYADTLPGIRGDMERVAAGEHEEGRIVRVRIGTRRHGPVLSWDAAGWANLYSRGGFGTQWASGGHWSSGSARYSTISAALNSRTYIVGGLKIDEPAGLLELLQPVLDFEGKRLEKLT